ncbi:uncharacterized protein LOC134694338 [Mytilus trossulus]|uniref:uncharacterized protein LOC134694338 n=1 Tax=Mytilus trossulus TaxID=6551 RepID=UPI003003BD8C
MTTNEIESCCNICLTRYQNKLAEEYCPQCEEALCGDCEHHHKISKSTKSHQTISLEKYNKLPCFIKQMKHNCEEHDCFLEFYCKAHDSLCCKLCLISGHKECKETIFIEDFLTHSTGYQPVALDNIEKSLKDLESNICSAIKDRNRNLTELREQKQKISEQIKEKRQEINTRLDNLEDALLEKASAMEDEYCLKINKVIAKLEDEKKKVDEIIEAVASVKMFASNLQIFMGTKTFQENVSTNEINVQVLYDNGNLNNITMECTFNEKLEELRDEVKVFGDIKGGNCDKHISFSWRGDKSAQLYKSILGANSIENINVRLIRKINIDVNGLSGCVISESGNMMFLHKHNNSLIKYSRNGIFISKSVINPQAEGIGFELALIDFNTVAVSSGGNYPQQIYLIDMNTTKTSQIFQLGDWCCGLSYNNNSFICCTYMNGIKIFDRSHDNLTNARILPNAPGMVDKTYVTSNKNHIFHTNWRDHSVVCYDFSGQVQWKYCDSILRQPSGITLDSYSNIYVAGSESNNVVVISKDGKQAKELNGAKDEFQIHAPFILIKTKTYFLSQTIRELHSYLTLHKIY